VLEYGTQYSVALLCRMSDPTFLDDSDLTCPVNNDYENHRVSYLDLIGSVDPKPGKQK
jgi:hypothetical protein